MPLAAWTPGSLLVPLMSHALLCKLWMTAVGVLVGRGSPHPPSCKALPHVVAEGALVGGAEPHTNRLEGGWV